MTMPGGQGVDHLSNVKEIHLFHHFLQVCTVSLKLNKVSTKFMIDAGLVSGWREFPEDNTIMTDKSPPIREYDSVNYTCYNKKLELKTAETLTDLKNFQVKCWRDANYVPEDQWDEVDNKWPICFVSF